ncbi:MAG: DEAD/DEAH box helicase, partial [Planctomycetota bacterium]|nr:DEAD/DEAH box helicase [Planctomycetota bacterium]
SFPFEDTTDQVEVTVAIKEDMQTARPMDRLVCGDVGYGKTELAMRAVFKAVEGGRQAAVLVPTTLLAQQHYKSFAERMAGFPVTIDVLSRFRTRAQQQEVVERASKGQLDILIGTHRLLSRDVGFRNLGLVVIDEEQRFGVVHKEKLKQLRKQVDVLTLSATPIPRTLHMALLGIRDISSLATAPQGRMAIQTEISHFDSNHMREIIIRELNRDGQVYLVHNRVMDIEVLESEVRHAVPEARTLVVHGQMKERELETRMGAFMRHEADVLIATTIIESGIDIPRVNTIIINEADRYGLADLHQLRGRVGRYKHQAYCYLFLPEQRHVNPDALKRLKALVEFSGLGSGFQIAMRDLEIRGAGNILGKQQSGHIATVGYEMYCRLLEKCVHTMKDERYSEPVSVEIDLALRAFIPDEFIRSQETKLEIYRKISTARSRDSLDDFSDELRDCYGKPPPPVAQLFDLQRLRIDCNAWEIEYIGCEEGNLLLRGGEKMKGLLDGCPCRVVVLDSSTVAVCLEKEGLLEKAKKPGKEVFLLVSQWLETGEFPQSRRLGRRFVDISK